MVTRPRAAARRLSRSSRTDLCVRPELLELESRDQPTRLGLSIATSPAADLAHANVAAVTSELRVAAAHGNGHGVGGAADAPGLTIAAAVASSRSAVVEVFSASTIQILITFTPAPDAVKPTPSESAGDSSGETDHAVARRPAAVASAGAAPSDVVTTAAAAPTVAVAPTATPVATPVTTPVSITLATAAAFNAAPTNVVPPAAPAAAAPTTAFAVVPQTAAVTTPQAGGGGGRTEIAAAMANTITGVAYPPAAADRTGVPTGTPAADETPAPQPPTTEGDMPAAATNPAKAEEKADEGMSFTSRLTAIVASVAVTMYGFWYWWHRSVRSRGGSALRLVRRGTTDV